jgi:hypothetical protein
MSRAEGKLLAPAGLMNPDRSRGAPPEDKRRLYGPIDMMGWFFRRSERHSHAGSHVCPWMPARTAAASRSSST